MQTGHRLYLKFVDYSSFLRWDVKRYNIHQDFNFEKTYRLSEILTPYKQFVSKEELKKKGWLIISKINFSGELFLRDFEEIETYKGNLLLVPDDAILYSKINVRHGCIYYHNKGGTPFAVSSEYPTYKFDESIVNGFFLQMLLRSTAFKKLLKYKD